ncbi:hypothetical protein ABFT23_18600 [Nocardioides sp. C4-1]|uniref:hypothetical protein n=1 Tax=Nocardioides sp. C4-1 TaxID=3151851 RepID=UPI00326362C6
MNLSQTPSRTRLTTLGASIAAVVLSVSLSACGGDELDENTTCDELTSMSTDEVFDAFKEAAENEGGEQGDAAVEAIESVPDDQRDTFADTLKGACDGEDGDTKLEDLSAF